MRLLAMKVLHLNWWISTFSNISYGLIFYCVEFTCKPVILHVAILFS